MNAKHFKFFKALSVVPAGQVATVGHKDERLFSTLAAAAEQRMRDYKSQQLANTAWALTDSAACAPESWGNEVLGGGAEGDGLRAECSKKDERPKLDHFWHFFVSVKRFVHESFQS